MRNLAAKNIPFGGFKSEHTLSDVLFIDADNPMPVLPAGVDISNIVFEDTNQRDGKHDNIHETFKRAGIVTINHILDFGDYAKPTLSHYVVDTKRDIRELCKTVVQNQWRNKVKYEKATRAGFSLIILTETDEVTCTDDLLGWHNPQCYGSPTQRACPFYAGMLCDPADKRIPCERYAHLRGNQKPADGERLVRGIRQMEGQFSIYFKYCKPSDTGDIILDFLSRK